MGRPTGGPEARSRGYMEALGAGRDQPHPERDECSRSRRSPYLHHLPSPLRRSRRPHPGQSEAPPPSRPWPDSNAPSGPLADYEERAYGGAGAVLP